MALIETIETECPICEEPITLFNFDPEDKTEDGQDIKCSECGAVFTDWTMENGELVIDIESAVVELDEDEGQEDEADEDEADEDEADEDEADEDEGPKV